MAARGLIKIEKGGGGGIPLFDLIIDANDMLAEMAPQASNFLSWLNGSTVQEETRDNQRDWQRFSSYLKGGYALYADNLELTYHNRQTDQYNGMGDNGTVATNAENYREVKFQTQVTQRDPDLPIGPVDPLRRGSWNPFEYIGAIVQYGLDSMAGVAELKAFYKARAEFMRDLDDVEVKVSSVMFTEFRGAYLTASTMKMNGGATEAFFDVTIKEVSKLTSPGSDNVHAVAQPGARS